MGRKFLGFTQSSTKTYKDRVYGISIDYPRSWKKKDGVREAVVLFIAPKTSPAEMFAANVNITVQDLSGQDTTLDRYVQSMIERQKGFIERYELLGIEPTTLAGCPACKIEFSGQQVYTKLRFMQVCTIKGQRAYAITCAAEGNKFSDFITVVGEMVNSFTIKA